MKRRCGLGGCVAKKKRERAPDVLARNDRRAFTVKGLCFSVLDTIVTVDGYSVTSICNDRLNVYRQSGV